MPCKADLRPQSLITRRIFLQQGTAAAATLAAASPGSEAASPLPARARPARRPNVLILIMDQLRADILGCYGNTFCGTPEIDRLARRGVRFERAYCGFPQCSPARAALMTGLYPNKTGIGIQSNYRAFGDLTVERLHKDIPSIGTIFRQAGYATGYVGKWHLSPQEPPADLADYGFDFFSPLPSQGSKRQPFPQAREMKKGPPIAGICQPNPLWKGGMSGEAVRFIDRNSRGDRPFLLFYSDVRPHPSYFLPREDFERFAPQEVPLWGNTRDSLEGKPLTHRRLRENILGSARLSDEFWRETIRYYSAIVSATDHQVGRVYRALESNGILDDTIVVFVSDHGDTCGAHGFLSKGVVAYEELVRIPMIISGPGRFAANRARGDLVGLMDILPTLMEAAGIGDPGVRVDGASLVPLLKNEPPAGWRQSLLIMHHGNMYGLCTMRAVVGQEHKYVYYPYDTCELYDVKQDPLELRNLIDDRRHGETAFRMREQMKELMEQAGDTKMRLF